MFLSCQNDLCIVVCLKIVGVHLPARLRGICERNMVWLLGRCLEQVRLWQAAACKH